MKKIIVAFLSSSFLLLNASSPGEINKNNTDDLKSAVEDIKAIEKALKESKPSAVNVKSKGQLKIEAEREAKEGDTKKRLDININALKKMVKSIPLTYTISDVEFGLIGVTKFYVYDDVFRRALKDLRENKELRNEINTYLRTVSSSKNIESTSLMSESYNMLKSKYTQWSMKSTKLSSADEYKGNGKRVGFEEGIVSNGIIAKIVGKAVELRIN